MIQVVGRDGQTGVAELPHDHRYRHTSSKERYRVAMAEPVAVSPQPEARLDAASLDHPVGVPAVDRAALEGAEQQRAAGPDGEPRSRSAGAASVMPTVRALPPLPHATWIWRPGRMSNGLRSRASLIRSPPNRDSASTTFCK